MWLGQGDVDLLAALEERFNFQSINLVAADVRRLILENPQSAITNSQLK